METSGRSSRGKLGDVKVVQQGGKTYIIVVKDDKAEHGVGLGPGCREGFRPSIHVGGKTQASLPHSRDSVKRSLANFDDDDDDFYCTPTADLAHVFGIGESTDGGLGRSQSAPLNGPTTDSSNFTAIVSKTNAADNKTLHMGAKIEPKTNYKATKRKQNLQGYSDAKTSTDIEKCGEKPSSSVCLSRKLFASPEPGSEDLSYLKAAQKTPVTIEKPNEASPNTHYAYKTPTPELPSTKHGAVRKIFIVQESPTFPKSSTPNQKHALKNNNFSPTIVLTPQRTANNEIVFSPVTNWMNSSRKPLSPTVMVNSPVIQSPIIQSPIIHSPTTQSPSAERKPQTEKAGKSLDDSLTNIQWLGALASEGLVPTSAPGVPTGSEIEKMSQNCGLHKRPAFSYMMLIRMALNTRSDKRMTLREICKWIEETFPFYKHTAKPGWKNSIRHNLSVYDIFVRVPSNPRQHGSQWTVREANAKKSKYSKPKVGKVPAPGVLSTVQLTALSAPSIALNSAGLSAGSLGNMKKKKGPTPILPRPPTSTPVFGQSPVLPQQLQAYALIPISSLGSGLSGAGSRLTLPAQPHTNIKMEPVISPTPTSVPTSAPPSTAPETSRRYTCDVIKEAWLTASAMETENSVYTKPPSKKVKVKPGLPKPRMYSAKSVSRTGGKSKKVGSGSAAGCSGNSCSTPIRDSVQVGGEEGGLPTPLRQLLATPPPRNPLRSPGPSPRWLSPIAPSCTASPGLADGSFLDLLPTSLESSPTPIITPVKSLEAWMRIAAGLMDTPILPDKESAGHTPNPRDTESISHLLAEIDPCLVDEIDSSQLHLSWPSLDTNTHDCT